MWVNIHLKEIFQVNRVIKFFIISDLLLFGGWGLIAPIFALFIVARIGGADAIIVGLAAAVYWIVKSLLQIPIALYLDETQGEKDDFYALLLGLILAGFTAMAFLLVRSIAGLLVVEILHAVAFAFYVPAWSAIFSRHLDKERYAFEWSLNSATLGVASGVTALIGGALAKFLGFEAVFVSVAVLSFASALTLFLVPDLILPKVKSNEPMIQDHSPRTINK